VYLSANKSDWLQKMHGEKPEIGNNDICSIKLTFCNEKERTIPNAIQHLVLFYNRGPRLLSQYSNSLRAGRSGDRIPVGSEIFPTRPETALRPTQPPVPVGTGSILGDEAAGTWRWPPPPSSAEVKERVELYLYSSSGPSWPVLGRPLPLSFIFLLPIKLL